MPDDDVNCNDIMLEITAGVGGQEAMIFSQELFKMYNCFSHYKGWQCEVADYCNTDMGNFLAYRLNENDRRKDVYTIELMVLRFRWYTSCVPNDIG